jgi:hypothetical protein
VSRWSVLLLGGVTLVNLVGIGLALSLRLWPCPSTLPLVRVGEGIACRYYAETDSYSCFRSEAPGGLSTLVDQRMLTIQARQGR